MTTQTVALHPILGAVAIAQDALTAVRDAQPVFLTPAEKETAVAQIARAEAMLAELKLRVVAVTDDAASDAGARDNGAWWASVTRADFPIGRTNARLAEALDRRWTAVAAGMTDGLVSADQARVVVEVLDDLPDHLEPELLARAETEMVSLCGHFRPSELRRLGRHLVEVVAPEIAEAEEAKRLENEEQRALEKLSVRTKRLGGGISRTTIVHPDANADRLRTYLESYTSPRKHQDAISGKEDRIPHHRQLGQAFCALLEHLDPARLPAHGGDAAQWRHQIPPPRINGRCPMRPRNTDPRASSSPSAPARRTHRRACYACRRCGLSRRSCRPPCHAATGLQGGRGTFLTVTMDQPEEPTMGAADA